MNNIFALDIGSSSDYAAGILLTRNIKKQKPLSNVRILGVNETINVIQQKWVTLTYHPELHTPYKTIASYTKNLLNDAQLAGDCWLLVDRGEAGNAVIEMLYDLNLSPLGIRSTSGTNISDSSSGPGYNVPHTELIQALRVEVEQQIIRVSKDVEHQAKLLQELKTLKAKKTSNKKALHYEAAREKDHDDLVMALAMAVWFSRKVWPKETLVQPDNKNQEEYDPFSW